MSKKIQKRFFFIAGGKAEVIEKLNLLSLV
jgi:hypothetical protein